MGNLCYNCAEDKRKMAEDIEKKGQKKDDKSQYFQ